MRVMGDWLSILHVTGTGNIMCRERLSKAFTHSVPTSITYFKNSYTTDVR